MQNKKIMSKIESVFIILFLIYLLLNSILPYVNLKPEIIGNAISASFMLAGGIIIIYNFFTNRSLFTKNYAWILWIYIFICCISSFTMIKYGYFDNLKTIIWSCILFGVLYLYTANNNKEQVKKVIKIAFISLSIVWSIAILIGIYQYIMQIGYQVKLDGGTSLKAQGFFYNRLFGIFVDPNFAAVTSVILLFASWYGYKISSKYWKKSIWILNLLIQLIYIILSGSRTGFVVLTIGFLIYVFLKFKIILSNKEKNNLMKTIIKGLFTIICIIAAFFVLKTTLEYIPNLINRSNESNINNSVNKGSENNNNNNINKDNVNKVELNRTDLKNKGVSNLRFQLWGDCLKIFKSKMLFGTSPRNLIPYAKDIFPNTYPARGLDYGNGYLSVLVGTGIVGAIVIFLFLIAIGKKIIVYTLTNKYQKESSECELNILSLTIIGIMLVAGFINQELFLINSINTALFWLLLGYLMEKTNERIPMENNKEKIGIITIHDADNYGSSLQAFATQKVIDNLGYNAVIIDHKCKKINAEYGIKRIFVQKNLKAIIETIIRILTIYPSRIQFKKFREKYFNMQDELSVVHEQKKFKKFVVGSDQVWNYKITGFDKAYFLDCVDDSSKKVSYASSFGLSKIEENIDEYTRLLNDFHFISVREEQAADIIKELTGRVVKTVLDPTLLIAKNEWEEIVKLKKHYKNYILCYQIAYSQTLVDFAIELSKKTNKKIISIQGSLRHKFEAKYIWNAGPIEYIDLFLNADYIITNSFHGTAFSINFNKNFFTELLPSFEKTSSRLENILDLFQLRDRQIVDGKNENMLKDINYEKQNKILQNNRQQSIQILKKFLEENE